MKQKVSDMLSVLPYEMKEIRDRETVMLEKERISEKNKNRKMIKLKFYMTPLLLMQRKA